MKVFIRMNNSFTVTNSPEKYGQHRKPLSLESHCPTAYSMRSPRMHIILGAFLLVSCMTLGIDSTSDDEFVDRALSAVPVNISLSNTQPLIVGGTEAQKNEFPWLVYLSIRNSKGTYFCGGALIQLNQVLTAAHCIEGANTIAVTAGDHDLSRTEGTEQTIQGNWTRRHGQYSRDPRTGRLIHDIAIIHLSRSFRSSMSVSTIRLPAPGATINSTASSRGMVAGWGATSFNGPSSRVLLKADVPIVTNSSCTRQLRDRDSQFCAGSPGRDICQGDSGGPFLCNSLPNQICGIVSQAYECARPNYPGIYTKVSEYIYWINGTTAPTTTTTPRTGNPGNPGGGGGGSVSVCNSNFVLLISCISALVCISCISVLV